MSGRPVDRRLVLRRLGQAALVLGGSGALAGLGIISPGRWRPGRGAQAIPDHAVPASAGTPPFAIARGDDPARLVAAAIDRIGGIRRFVKPGETVLVKPNMAWDRTPEQGANTHPAIVAAVVRQCRDAGAKRVIVGEVPVHDASRTAERSGIRRAALEAGAETVFPPSAVFRPALLGGTVLEQWDVLAVLFQADRVINVPVPKDHALSRMTCGFKNWYGLLGGTRARLHQEIHPCIADLAAAIRPTLTVVDATRVMLRGGPTGGRLEDVAQVHAVAAGTDPVALEAWSATLLNLDPRDVPHIVLAQGKGLGSIDAGLVPQEEIRV